MRTIIAFLIAVIMISGCGSSIKNVKVEESRPAPIISIPEFGKVDGEFSGYETVKVNVSSLYVGGGDSTIRFVEGEMTEAENRGAAMMISRIGDFVVRDIDSSYEYLTEDGRRTVEGVTEEAIKRFAKGNLIGFKVLGFGYSEKYLSVVAGMDKENFEKSINLTLEKSVKSLRFNEKDKAEIRKNHAKRMMKLEERLKGENYSETQEREFP